MVFIEVHLDKKGFINTEKIHQQYNFQNLLWWVLALAYNTILWDANNNTFWQTHTNTSPIISIKQAQNWPPRVTAVGYLILRILRITPILNSHLQPIHSSQFHSSQTRQSSIAYNSFKFTVNWYATTELCEIVPEKTEL